MAKKRQADFPSTQIRPGRQISKRKNVTNTAFKSKKIVMQRNKGLKDQSSTSKTIGDYLTAIKTTSKAKEFDELRKQIEKDVSSLPLYLSDILNCTFKTILQGDDNQRTAAVEVVCTVFVHTTDLQIHGYIAHFNKVLSCAMTHTSIRIKEQSLILLNSMLRTHPKLICDSINILTNLLQLLTGTPRKWSHSNRSPGKNSLETLYSDNMYSPDWRIHVLGHINLFLTEMLKDKSTVEDQERDEQEVYWDGERPLHLEIYAGGGLKPMDIEKSLPSNFDCDDLHFDDPANIELFVEIIQILQEIFIEEIASEIKHDDNQVSRSSIVNLGILFQVLCKVTEWMHLISYNEMDDSVKKFLHDTVWNKRRFPFYPRGVSNQEASVVKLNLAVCFLFAKFLAEPGNEDDSLNEYIFSYITKILSTKGGTYSNVKYESIPIIVKIVKIYFGMRETPEVLVFLRTCLTQLCGLLKGSNDNSNERLLSSLFVKMSLDSAYYFLVETDVMRHWFSWLLNQLAEIPKIKDKSKKIDRKLLNVIKKIANRKYPYFLELLQKQDSKVVKALLKFDDDDVRDTAIFLIYNMKDINASFLKYVSQSILSDSKFPTKLTVRLIRLLWCRFSEKLTDSDRVPEASIYNPKGLINFTEFLLNFAIDAVSINEKKLTDYETNEYTAAMKIYKDATAFTLFPSLHWKEHSKIFEVCMHILNQLHEDAVKFIARKTIREALEHTNVLPMHSAIAILKLFKHENNEYFDNQIFDLIFCTLLTISILTQMPIEDEWYKWNVVELMNSMELDVDIALNTLEDIKYFKDDQIDGIAGYHILRVIKFYLEHHLLNPKFYSKVIEVFEILTDKTSDKTFSRQPLYITLYNHFRYYCEG